MAAEACFALKGRDEDSNYRKNRGSAKVGRFFPRTTRAIDSICEIMLTAQEPGRTCFTRNHRSNDQP